MTNILLIIGLGLWAIGFILMVINLFRKYSLKLQVIASLCLISGITGTFLLGFYKIFLLFKELYTTMNG